MRRPAPATELEVGATDDELEDDELLGGMLLLEDGELLGGVLLLDDGELLGGVLLLDDGELLGGVLLLDEELDDVGAVVGVVVVELVDVVDDEDVVDVVVVGGVSQPVTQNTLCFVSAPLEPSASTVSL
ncbi:MAG TPA: hypothetical protein VKD67_00420, partial [Acidimicrobiales bacterium]|nr:hypothetical protein [Acidimicrobiales bacterium]